MHLRVYVLDERGKARTQMLSRLSECKSVDGILVFDDWVGFLEQTGSTPPDYCFIRLGRDGIPGFKAAEAVRKISTDIRIVFIAEDERYAVDAYEVGAYGYLTYPLTKEKINNYIKGQK